MTNQNTVRVCYLQATGIQKRFEGVVGDAVGFGLLGNHSHGLCRGDVLIPSGVVMIVSELYGGLAYLLEFRRPGDESRDSDIILCKLWQVSGHENRFYGTMHLCVSALCRVPDGTGFTLYRNRRDFGLTVNRTLGRTRRR